MDLPALEKERSTEPEGTAQNRSRWRPLDANQGTRSILLCLLYTGAPTVASPGTVLYCTCTAAGKGLYRFRNGDVYKGDFQDNHMTGQGVMEFNNGDR
jgi:hypothetical protein